MHRTVNRRLVAPAALAVALLVCASVTAPRAAQRPAPARQFT